MSVKSLRCSILFSRSLISSNLDLIVDLDLDLERESDIFFGLDFLIRLMQSARRFVAPPSTTSDTANRDAKPRETALLFKKNPDMAGKIDIVDRPLVKKDKLEPRERSIELDREFYVGKIRDVIDSKNSLIFGVPSDPDANHRLFVMGKILDNEIVTPGLHLAEWKESESSKLAKEIEERVYKHFLDKMYREHHKKFLHHVIGGSLVVDQIQRCNEHIQESVRRKNVELREDNLKTCGLEKPFFKSYKNAIIDISGSLRSIVYRLQETVSVEHKVHFDKLTFVEKTVVIFRVFRETFTKKASSEKNFDDQLTFSGCFEVPGLLGATNSDEKTALRKTHYPRVTSTHGMRFKEMIGVYTFCVRHYSREEKWKRDFVNFVLVRECPEMFPWHTTELGPWMAGEIQELVHSLGYQINFRVDESYSSFLRAYSYEFTVQKRKALSSLFLDICHDEKLADRNVFTMRLKFVGEPPGQIRNQESTREHQCSHETCKSYNTVFVTQWQSRSQDEDTDIFVICKDCWQLTKVET